MIKQTVAIISIVFCMVFFSCQKPDFGIRVMETGVYNMHQGYDLIDKPGMATPVDIPVELINARSGQVELSVSVEDMWGIPVILEEDCFLIQTNDMPDSGLAGIRLTLPNGFYRVQIDADNNGDHFASDVVEIGIVPPGAEGLRKNSFFASNTSDIKLGKDLDLLDLVGIKVQRTHFYPDLVEIPEIPSSVALPFDYTRLRAEYDETVDRGIWVLPIAGYAFPGTRSDLAIQMNNHGPPRHFEEFSLSWVEIIREFPDIRVYELWNEPWIYEWTWAANAEDYRDLQELWCRLALQADPDLRIIAGNSCMFVEDHIEPFPEVWDGLIHATSHHPYAHAEARSLRHNAQIRSIDYGYLVNSRMMLPYYYITEGGTLFAGEPKTTIGSVFNNNVNAAKAVHYTVVSALHGAYQGNIQWNLGYGPAWTRSNTTLSVCSYFLEDRPVIADIWPENSLVYGAIFAQPDHICHDIQSLKRATDIDVRWKEPVPQGTAHPDMKVAVLFSLTGMTADAFDTSGRLVISNAEAIRAFDCTGREIPSLNNRLVLPFGEYPVYLTTSELSAIDFYRVISEADMEELTAVSASVSSLLSQYNKDQHLMVTLDNHLNRPVQGRISVSMQGTEIGSRPFSLKTGELKRLPLSVDLPSVNESNMYPVLVELQTDAGRFAHEQVLQQAVFSRGSRVVDGSLDDWEGDIPVILDSDMLRQGVELTQYLFNPTLSPPDDEDVYSRVAARVYTAYDDDYIYLAAEVLEDTLMNQAGKPAKVNNVETGYQLGVPGGLRHPRYTGDLFMFGFGFRDRVPGFGRQLTDPLAWKGQFYDTDYLYLAYHSSEGGKLIRQWGAETSRQNGFQTDHVDHIGQVAGASIVVARDEITKTTIYEMAIPRKEISLFDENETKLRFGFVLINNEGAGTGGKLEWAEAAGVFDYWLNSGSYAPTWDQFLPCQTFFGIGR